ncbi:MAG: DUF308 domain-containing protein [Methanoregulaceae archaeon]|nr:DUF308 domain-containing protein [Methanoregulaceae archaeon]
METRVMISGPSRVWWVGLIVFGIILVSLGLAAILLPDAVLHVLAFIFGFFSLIAGIGFLISARKAARQDFPWWPLLLAGIFAILVSIISFLRPDLVTAVFVILIAVLAIVAGIMLAVYGWVLPGSLASRLIFFVVGLVILIIGILMVVFPMPSATAFLRILGLFSIIAGVICLIGGVSMKIWGMRTVTES